MNLTPLGGRVYQGLEEFDGHLRGELGAWKEHWGPFYHLPDEAPAAYWTRNQWLDPFIVEFGSISEAASILRSIQRNWAPTLFTQFRRGELIRSKLPPIADKPRTFPWLLPDAPMGAWTLLNDHTLLASARCDSPFPGGILNLEENRTDPPSRAYLKLREALIRCRKWPAAGSRCLDAGATPGGWTWVLAELGAQVTAVDRAPPDERILARPNVRYLKHDAFTLKPAEVGELDWLFSDVICYPPRLYGWVEGWLASGLAKNFVCTIKMQGEADHETIRRFAAIPGSLVVHLHYNKHELTWIKVDN